MFLVIMKLLMGAIAGGTIGLFISRTRACSAGQCESGKSVALQIFYTVASAVFGASLTWYFMQH